MANLTVGLKPRSWELTFSLPYDQAMTVFLLLPQRKINAELTGWTPTGELGSHISFLSLWYDQARTVFLLLPRRKN